MGKLINGYFERRAELSCAFVLIDATIPPTKIDLDFVNSMGEMQVPFVLAFTKTDRLGKPQIDKNIADFLGKLSETWETLPNHFITSSERRTGREEILEFIAKTLRTMKL